MPEIKYLPINLDVENKSILVRLDLNVPIKNKEIQDHTRIYSSLPLLKDLVKRKAKIIIITHLGRPKGIKNKDLSLTPIYKFLKEKLNTNLYFFTGNIDSETKNKSSYLKAGEILLLDNIRFFRGENENDDSFAKNLSTLGDIYINDAFSCSHREQASVHKITKYVKQCYAGPLVKTEVEAIDSIIKDKKKPVTCIIGGSKISTKIEIIKNLIPKFENIVIVGGMANNVLKHKGFEIGKSINEDKCETIIKEIFSLAKKYNCKIVYPKDVSTGKNVGDNAYIKKLTDIKNDDMILDIGPETIEMIKSIIGDSKSVLWNGPAGYFENHNFAHGSIEIAKKIISLKNNIYSVAGGGDTIAVLNKTKTFEHFNFVSTAGGAFLEYLEGKEIPGIKALI